MGETNLIRRWLEARSRRQLEETAELLQRLHAFIDGLNGRLTPSSSRSIYEFASVGEWELAIDDIWQDVDDGALELSASERVELTAMTRHPNVNRSILSAGKKHLVDA